MYCQRLAPLLGQVLEKYPQDVKLVFKHYPIARHKFASKAAVASMAADSYGKFWAYHDRLFDGRNFGKFSDQKFIEIAGELGINQQDFIKKLKDPKIMDKVRRDTLEGQKAGVRGTPTIFINGKLLKVRTLKGFQDMIDKELELIKKQNKP